MRIENVYTLSEIYIEILYFDGRICSCWKVYSLCIEVLDGDKITKRSKDENKENEPRTVM